jgi:phosphate transport system substrate-binding protein
MERTSRIRASIWTSSTFVLACAIAVAGCGGSPSDKGSTSSSPAVSVTGAGSSFAYPLYSKWFAEYRKVDPNIQFDYQSIGSGAGIQQMIAGTIDFGGTDSPMSNDQMADFKTKRGANVLHFPVALGAVVATTNIPGVIAQLTFTPQVLADIFLGKITKWNDPALVAANPGVTLPPNPIVVVHRSDGSGTSFVWTDYLSKVSGEWKSKVGAATSVSWPAGVGGKGNEGVAGLVKQTPNSIGYVELIYALQTQLSYGRVKNRLGEAVQADLASVTAAAAGTAADMPDDFRVSITDAAGTGAYPISSYTWMLVPDRFTDPARKAAVVKFLGWALTTGQDLLEPLSYAKLAPAVVTKEQAAVAKIQ